MGQDQIEWCVTRGSSIYELFRQSEPNSIYGQLGRRMRNVSSADEGVQQVVKSNWAFIRERSILTFKVSCACRKKATKGRVVSQNLISVSVSKPIMNRET